MVEGKPHLWARPQLPHRSVGALKGYLQGLLRGFRALSAVSDTLTVTSALTLSSLFLLNSLSWGRPGLRLSPQMCVQIPWGSHELQPVIQQVWEGPEVQPGMGPRLSPSFLTWAQGPAPNIATTHDALRSLAAGGCGLPV